MQHLLSQRAPRAATRSRALPSALALAAMLLKPAWAEAFERQWHAGVDAGYAATSFRTASPLRGGSGVGGGVHFAYGWTDSVNGLVDLSYSRTAGTTIWSGAVGAAYALDVLQLVPYAGALVGIYEATGDVSKTAPGGQLALGLNYAVSREWALGLEGRFHYVLASDPVGSFPYGTAFLKAEYVWGF